MNMYLEHIPSVELNDLKISVWLNDGTEMFVPYMLLYTLTNWRITKQNTKSITVRCGLLSSHRIT